MLLFFSYIIAVWSDNSCVQLMYQLLYTDSKWRLFIYLSKYEYNLKTLVVINFLRLPNWIMTLIRFILYTSGKVSTLFCSQQHFPEIRIIVTCSVIIKSNAHCFCFQAPVPWRPGFLLMIRQWNVSPQAFDCVPSYQIATINLRLLSAKILQMRLIYGSNLKLDYILIWRSYCLSCVLLSRIDVKIHWCVSYFIVLICVFHC